MKPVAIIPARAGSKRLHRKNILPVLGKPILSYPIKAAVDSGIFETIIVSTEDPEIAGVAKTHGAKVLPRPENLTGDRATVAQVCLNVLDKLSKENRFPDYFCCIYATAIFITPDDLRDSFNLMHKTPEAEFVMGVSDFNLQPVQALVAEKSFLTPMWPDLIFLQSQFQPNLVASNGTLYWARSNKFIELKTFYGDRLKGFFIHRSRSIDIDTPEDLKLVKILAQQFFGDTLK